MSFGFHSLFRTYFSFYYELTISNVYQVDLLKVTFEENPTNLQGSTFTVQFYCSDESMINWVKEIGHQMLLQKLYRKFPKNWAAFASRLDFIKSYK